MISGKRLEVGHGFVSMQFGIWPLTRSVKIYGGPAKLAPKSMYSLNLRAEDPELPCTDLLPITDFGVPRVDKDTERALKGLLNAAVDNGEAYTGCAGGTGRTGLMLALCLKAAGESDPIPLTRATYKTNAMENSKQEEYVSSFYIGPPMRKALNRRAAIRALQFWK